MREVSALSVHYNDIYTIVYSKEEYYSYELVSVRRRVYITSVYTHHPT